MRELKPIKLQVSETELPVMEFRLLSAIPAGSFLRIKASGTTMLMGVKINDVLAGDIPLTIVHKFSRDEMRANWNWHIRTMSLAVVRVTEELPENSVIKVKMQPTSSSGQKYSGLTWVMRIGKVDSPESVDFQDVWEPAEILFIPGPPDHIEAYLKPDNHLMISHFDSHGNPTIQYDGKISVKAEDDILEVQKSPVTRIHLPKLVTRAYAKDENGREAMSNAHPVALDSTPIYFGEFHWHTDFSGDGQRSIEDALISARDELGLDFAGPADHMGQNGKYSGKTPEEQAQICKKFDDPGRFCTIPGSELSRRYGHANLYTDGFETFMEVIGRFAKELAPKWNSDPHRYGLKALTDLCPPGKALVVPHHTNMDSYVRERVVREDGRPFWCAMNFPIPADRDIVRIFEIVQGRGAFEAEETDPNWKIFNGGFGGSARTALTKGYRMGFIGGTDNHCGWPTRQGSGYVGLTAVQAKSLATKSIFKAIHERRCYATSGARIIADATLNGHPIGSELRLNPGEERKFHIKIQGTSPLVAVQVIHCGCILADLPVENGKMDFEMEWCDQRPGRALEDVYYYIRGRQEDGHCVWLSPFWVDLPD